MLSYHLVYFPSIIRGTPTWKPGVGVSTFMVDFNVDDFLLVLFIFLKYGKNFKLCSKQNKWINLFEMQERDSLSR